MLIDLLLKGLSRRLYYEVDVRGNEDTFCLHDNHHHQKQMTMIFENFV